MSAVGLRSGDRPAAIGSNGGSLILNADDWGRDASTTGRTLECVLCGAVSSVSAMVFMEDSERAAAIARERGIDAGLHLNFTTGFTAPRVPEQVVPHQERLAKYLLKHRLSAAVMHPGLHRSFEYVVASQLDEFQRIYGRRPGRIDGHHHMHLCANVVLRKLMPSGTVVRRNFTFRRGEKGFCNRMYRAAIDSILRRRHDLTDFLFNLSPLEPRQRLDRIFSLARNFAVEIETHPVNPAEYQFLTKGELFAREGHIPVAQSFNVKRRHAAAEPTYE